MRHNKHRSGRPYKRARKIMFATYGHTCHICGHPGATDADHLTAVSVDPDQPVDYTLMRPAHGVSGCPYCPLINGKRRKCNQSKGAGRVKFQPSINW